MAEWLAKHRCLRMPGARRHAPLHRKRLLTRSPVAFWRFGKEQIGCLEHTSIDEPQFAWTWGYSTLDKSAAGVCARSSNVQRPDANDAGDPDQITPCEVLGSVQAAVRGMDNCVNRSATAVPWRTCCIHVGTAQYGDPLAGRYVPLRYELPVAGACKPAWPWPVTNVDQEPRGRPRWRRCSLRDPIRCQSATGGQTIISSIGETPAISMRDVPAMVPKLLAWLLLGRTCDCRDEQVSRFARKCCASATARRQRKGTHVSLRRQHIGQLFVSAISFQVRWRPVPDGFRSNRCNTIMTLRLSGLLQSDPR